MDLQTFKAENPAYKDWDNNELALSLYNTYYRDKMPLNAFSQQIGFDTQIPASAPTFGSEILSVPKEAGKGVIKGGLELGESVGTGIEMAGEAVKSLPDRSEELARSEMNWAMLTPGQRDEAVNLRQSFLKAFNDPKIADQRAIQAVLQKDYLTKRIPAGNFLVGQGKKISNFWKGQADKWQPSVTKTGRIEELNVWDNPELLKSPVWWAFNTGRIMPSFLASIAPGAAVSKTMNAAGLAANMTPKVAAAFAKVGGMMAGGLAGGSLEGTGTYRQLIEGGASPDEALRSAKFMTLFSAGLNSISVGRMLEKAGPGFMARITRRGLNGIVEGITEGLEEPAEVMSIIASKLMGGEPVPEDVAVMFADSLKDAVTILGPAALSGGLMGGGGTVRTKSREEKDADLVDRYEEAAEENILSDEADNIAQQIIEKIGKGGPVRTKPPTVDELKQAEELRDIERQQDIEARKPNEWQMPLEEWLAKEGLTDNVLKTYPVSSLETMVKKHAGIVQEAVDQGLGVPQEVIDSVNQAVGVMSAPLDVSREAAPVPEKTEIAPEGTGATIEPVQPEFTVPRPSKGVYTLGGELNSMNGLDRESTIKAMGKADIRELPQSVQRLIKKGGEQFDLAEDRLKETGYLQQNEALADAIWSEPDVLKRRSASNLEETQFAEHEEEAPVGVYEEDLESLLSELETKHQDQGTELAEDPQAKAIADAFLVIDKAREAEESFNAEEYNKLYKEVDKRVSDIHNMGNTSFDVKALEGRRQKQTQFEGIEKRREEDRRRDEISRKKVDEMTPEEKDLMLLTSNVTGLPNRRAYDESDKKPVQGFFDLDVFKDINDTYGHHVGDRVLRRMADAFRDSGTEVYHISGDEYVVQANSESDIDNAAKKAYDYLEKNPVNVERPGKPKKQIKIGFSYGKGPKIEKAEEALQAHKDERKRLGKRWERDEKPETISEGKPERDKDSDRERSDRSEKLTPPSKAAESTKEETLPKTPETKKAAETTPQAQPTAEEKAPWEMTEGEYSEQRLKNMPRAYADRLTPVDLMKERRLSVKQALSEGKPVPAEVLKDYPDLKKKETPTEKIQDFGEKIGGARKDTAERGFKMTGGVKKTDTQPAWRKKYVAMEKVDGTGWTIGKKGDRWGLSGRRGEVFATEEEAEKAIPIYAVADNHRVFNDRENKDEFAIFKRVGKRKLFKVVNKVFPSREDGMKYMAQHAEEILNTKTTFGEEILPVPEIAIRTGKKRRTTEATPEMFMETFAPRGIEFGNWNNQEERQQVLNHAYDGMLDLAEVLNVSPKALMLNGDLAIAFGARGQGLSGAKAHYEPSYGVINLTKMKGAGSLAHEWFHALDHYLARRDTKAPSEKVTNKRGNLVYKDAPIKRTFQSHGKSYTSEVRPELQKAYDDIIETMYRKAEKYVEDMTYAEKFLGKARDNLKKKLDSIHNDLAKDYVETFTWRKNKRGLKPASAEQLAEFDNLANTIIEGGNLETEWIYPEKARTRLSKGRHSNEILEAMSVIYKAVRNRTGFDSQHRRGVLDGVVAAMDTYAGRIKLFEDAKKGTSKTKKVPTSYAVEAKKMDQARSGDYWSEPHEMAARAFAAYVEDKVAEQGNQSDFIVYHAHGGILLPMIDGFVARPYPEGKERQAINQSFDAFVEIVKSRETEKGVELYSTKKSTKLRLIHPSKYTQTINGVPVEYTKRNGEWTVKSDLFTKKAKTLKEGRKLAEKLINKESPTVTPKDVPQFFPGQKVIHQSDTTVIVQTKGGMKLAVEFVDKITPNEIAFRVGYKRDMKPNEFIVGKQVGNKIFLVKDKANKWILSHESTHLAERMGFLNKTDQSVLKLQIKREVKAGTFKTSTPEDMGGWEDRAEWMAREVHRDNKHKPSLQRIIQKIKDFIDGLVNLYRRTPGGIVREFKSGENFDKKFKPVPVTITPQIKQKALREGMPMFKAQEQYSVKKLDKDFSQDIKEAGSFVKKALKERKRGWAEQKPDTKLISRVLSVPLHYFDKIPAMQRMFDAGLRWMDNKHSVVDDLVNSEDGQSYIKVMDDFRKQRRKEYKRWTRYLIARDKNAKGYSVSEKDGSWILHDPAGKKVRSFADENEAWREAINYEVTDFAKHGYSEQAQDALRAFRAIGHNTYEQLAGQMREYIKQYKERGKEIPKIVVRQGEETVSVDLQAALSIMGDRRGHYMPRMRKSGRYRLIATKKGENPVMKFYDTKTMLAIAASTYRKQGYKIEKSRARKMPEVIFEIAGKQVGIQAMVNEALRNVGQAKAETLSHFGLSGEWGRYKGQDDYMVKGAYTKDIKTAFETLNGRYYALGQGQKVWHFMGAPKDIESQIIKRIQEVKGVTPDTEMLFAANMIQQVADIIRSRGARSKMITRKEATGKDVWVGYEEDPIIAMTRSAQGIAGAEAKRQLAVDLTQYITGTDIKWSDYKRIKENEGKKAEYLEYIKFVNKRKIDAGEQQNAFNDAVAYMQHMLRNDEQVDRIMGTVKGLAVLKYLGGRISAPVVNLTAMVTSVPATMKGYAGIPINRSAKYVGQAMNAYRNWSERLNGKKTKLDGWEQDLFKTIEKNGWHKAQLNHEAIAVLQGKLGRSWNKAMELSMIGFGVTEQMNRVSTIAGTYMGIRDRHKGTWGQEEHENAIKTAKKVSDRAHGVYGKANLPHFAQGGGIGAQGIRAFYVFRTFSHNYLLTMYDLGFKKKQASSMLYMALSPAIFAGVGASVFTPILTAIAKGIGMDDPEEKFYNWLEDTYGKHSEQLARFGLFGAAGYGVSLKGSLAIGITDLPTTLEDVVGAPGSMVLDMYRGGKSILRGDVGKGIEKMMPLFLGNVMKAHREYTEGVTTKTNAPVFYGREQIKPDTVAAIYRFFSFNPVQVAGKREKQWKEFQLERKYQEKRADVYAKFKRYFLRPANKRTKAEYIDLLTETKIYNQAIIDNGLYPAIPLITATSIKNNIKRSFRPKKKERYRK